MDGFLRKIPFLVSLKSSRNRKLKIFQSTILPDPKQPCVAGTKVNVNVDAGPDGADFGATDGQMEWSHGTDSEHASKWINDVNLQLYE